MKVSEVIKRLNELKKELGDVDCEIYMEDIDGTQIGIDEINEIDISTDEEGLDAAIYIAHMNKGE